MPFKEKGAAPNAQKGWTGELRVMQQLSQHEFGVELWLMRDGRNANSWDFRNLEEHYLTFVGQPILVAYVLGQIGDGHNMKLKRDPVNGEAYYSFTDGTAERIVGTLSDDPKDFTLVKRDGHTWIVAKGRLFTFYARELVEKIVRTGRMAVSVEVDSVEEREENGITVITKWIAHGVTILGDKVAPAIPGARIAALAAMQEEFKTLKLKAASYQKNDSKKGVKRGMNRKAAQALAAKFEGCKIVALSEDGKRVGLIDKSGCAYTYAFNEEDNGEVVKARIKPAYLTAGFNFDDGEVELADVGEIVEYACDSVRESNMNAKDLSEKLEAANKRIGELEAAEHTRRVEAVKAAVEAALNAIKQCAANGDEDMTPKANELIESAEAYAGMEANGKFCGAERARADLMAAQGEAEMRKRTKAMSEKKHAYAWNEAKTGGNSGGIAEMLSFINGGEK